MRYMDVTETFKKLPRSCFVVIPGDDKIGQVRRGENGYHACPPVPPGRDPKAWARKLNEQDGVTEAQAEAMLNGSMFGWDIPGADPDVVEKINAEVKARRRKQK